MRKKVPERNEGREMVKETPNSGHGHWLGQLIPMVIHKENTGKEIA